MDDPGRGAPVETASPAGGGDPRWDDWDTPLRAPDTPVFHLDGFDGPMALLLDLAERQRIDLGRLSVAELAAQFVAECEGRLRAMPLAQRADWLVMAARLLLLRSRLLFPADAATAAAAEREARAEMGRLEGAMLARAAASWLGRRPYLGLDVFARPRRGPDPRVASTMALMEACLVLPRERSWREAEVPMYRPAIPELWRVRDAVDRIRLLLAEDPAGGALRVFLLPVAGGPLRPLRARAVVASSFVAALELCRSGEVAIAQEGAFGAIALGPVAFPKVR